MTKPIAVLLTVALSAGCAQQNQSSEPGEPAAGAQGTAPAASSSSSAAPAAGAASLTGGAPVAAQKPAAPAASGLGTAATPAVPPKPQFKEVTIPASTALSVTLDTAVASDTSRVEDSVRGKLAKPIVIDGLTAIPAGAALNGSVTEAVRSGKVKGRASVAFRFNSITAGDEKHDISTARIARRAASTKGDDAKKVGIGAGAGAVIGALAGGGKGAAIGGAIGAGAGTGVVVATRGDEVEIPVGATVSTTLQQPLSVRVPID